MRFRHRTTPQRASIRERSDTVLDQTRSEVLSDNLPGEDNFPSGVLIGDPYEPPAQVENAVASAGLRTILVEWDRLEGHLTVDGAGGYEVELDTVNTFDSGSERTQRTSATMASFTDLTPATTYYVRVRGVQGAENYGTWSATANATTATADTADITAGAVTTDRLAADAVTAAKLAAITMEVGKWIQSDNYDGTDVATGDATQGFRVEASGLAEFQDVRIRADELEVNQEDPETADVFRIGTHDETLSDGLIDPTPGNRVEFRAIADNGTTAYAQSIWHVDADNGMDPAGDGSGLVFRNELYKGDYLGPPTLDDIEVMRLEGGLSPKVLFEGDRAWPAYYAVAERTSNQVITTGTATTLLLSSSEYDPDSFHNGSGVFTIPFSGLWLVYGYLTCTTSTAGARLLLGWNINSGADRWQNNGGTPNTAHVSFAEPVELAAGQAIRFRVYQDTGGNCNVQARARISCLSPGQA